RHTRFSRDWSSDVCSSDLGAEEGAPIARVGAARLIAGTVLESLPPTVIAVGLLVGVGAFLNAVLNSQGVESEVWQAAGVPFVFEIGRASWRERVEGEGVGD